MCMRLRCVESVMRIRLGLRERMWRVCFRWKHIDDYEILFVNAPQLEGHLQIERGHKKRLYFTYQGLIKVIIQSCAYIQIIITK